MDAVDLDSFRLEQTFEGDISLRKEDGSTKPITAGKPSHTEENKDYEGELIFGDIKKIDNAEGYSYLFDGSGDYMELRDPVLDHAKSFSISFELNLSNGSQGIIIGKNETFLIGYDNNKIYFDSYNGTDWGEEIYGANTLSYNQWHNITTTYDYSSDTLSIYLDGVLDTRTNIADKINNSDEKTYVGYLPILESSWYANASIDNIMIWGRSLENIEVAGFNYSSVLILHPNGNETLDLQSPLLINWSVINPLPRMLATYSLEYSNNNGSGWYEIVSNWGFIDSFNDSSIEKNIEFSGNENKTIYLKIPKNATIINAELDLIGGGV